MKATKPLRSKFCLVTKSIALFLCISLIASEIPVFAFTKQVTVTPKAGDSHQAGISIPSQLGTLEESHTSYPGAPTILYIQDAHDSIEAQENIAKLIHHFVETEGVKTVLEEGHEGPVPTDAHFDSVEDPKIKEKIAYFLMDRLRLGGAEYAHINRKKDFMLIGVDSNELHLKNLEAYQLAASKREAVEKDLGVLEGEIKRLNHLYFPKELKDWIKLKKRFDQNKIDLLNYLKRLVPLRQRTDPSDGLWRKGEGRVRGNNIALLLSAEKSNNPELLKKVNLIDAKTLFKEIEAFEQSFAQSYLKNERDKKLFYFYQSIQLLYRLIQMEITATEYEVVKERLKSFDTKVLAQFLVKQTGKPIVLSKNWENGIQKAIQFYEIANARDLAMEENLKKYFSPLPSATNRRTDPSFGGEGEGRIRGNKKAVLIFGGFHKTRIKEILKRKGYSYHILMPKMTGISKRHQDYYKRLMSVGHYSFEPSNFVRMAAEALSYLRVLKPNSTLLTELEAFFETNRDANAVTLNKEAEIILNRFWKKNKRGSSEARAVISEKKPLSFLAGLKEEFDQLGEKAFLEKLREDLFADTALDTVVTRISLPKFTMKEDESYFEAKLRINYQTVKFYVGSRWDSEKEEWILRKFKVFLGDGFEDIREKYAKDLARAFFAWAISLGFKSGKLSIIRPSATPFFLSFNAYKRENTPDPVTSAERLIHLNFESFDLEKLTPISVLSESEETRSESRRQDALASSLKRGDPLFVIVQAVSIVWKSQFYNSHVFLENSYVFFQNIQFVQFFMYRLKLLTKNAKLAAEVFKNHREFTIAGIISSFYWFFAHASSPINKRKRNLSDPQEGVNGNLSIINKNMQNNNWQKNFVTRSEARSAYSVEIVSDEDIRAVMPNLPESIQAELHQSSETISELSFSVEGIKLTLKLEVYAKQGRRGEHAVVASFNHDQEPLQPSFSPASVEVLRRWIPDKVFPWLVRRRFQEMHMHIPITTPALNAQFGFQKLLTDEFIVGPSDSDQFPSDLEKELLGKGRNLPFRYDWRWAKFFEIVHRNVNQILASENIQIDKEDVIDWVVRQSSVHIASGEERGKSIRWLRTLGADQAFGLDPHFLEEDQKRFPYLKQGRFQEPWPFHKDFKPRIIAVFGIFEPFVSMIWNEAWPEGEVNSYETFVREILPQRMPENGIIAIEPLGRDEKVILESLFEQTGSRLKLEQEQFGMGLVHKKDSLGDVWQSIADEIKLFLLTNRAEARAQKNRKSELSTTRSRTEARAETSLELKRNELAFLNPEKETRQAEFADPPQNYPRTRWVVGNEDDKRLLIFAPTRAKSEAREDGGGAVVSESQRVDVEEEPRLILDAKDRVVADALSRNHFASVRYDQDLARFVQVPATLENGNEREGRPLLTEELDRLTDVFSELDEDFQETITEDTDARLFFVDRLSQSVSNIIYEREVTPNSFSSHYHLSRPDYYLDNDLLRDPLELFKQLPFVTEVGHFVRNNLSTEEAAAVAHSPRSHALTDRILELDKQKDTDLHMQAHRMNHPDSEHEEASVQREESESKLFEATILLTAEKATGKSFESLASALWALHEILRSDHPEQEWVLRILSNHRLHLIDSSMFLDSETELDLRVAAVTILADLIEMQAFMFFYVTGILVPHLELMFERIEAPEFRRAVLRLIRVSLDELAYVNHYVNLSPEHKQWHDQHSFPAIPAVWRLVPKIIQDDHDPELRAEAMRLLRSAVSVFSDTTAAPTEGTSHEAEKLRRNYTAAVEILHQLTPTFEQFVKEAEDVQLVMTGIMALEILARESKEARRQFERLMEKFVFTKEDLPGVSDLKLSGSIWLPGVRQELRKKMPTLMKIDSDKRFIIRFLTYLSALRMAYPYYLINDSNLTPLEWAEKQGVMFKLRELTILPASESFRRHIIYVEDENKDKWATEIKMPGEQDNKSQLRPRHVRIAQLYLDTFGEDADVVEPLYYLGLSGKFPIYGPSPTHKEYRGIVGLRYQDGKRLRNALQHADMPDSYFDRVARENGLTHEQLFQKNLIDVLTFVIRLHRFGYRGSSPRGTDLHFENFLLRPDGRTVSIADFQAMTHLGDRFTMMARQGETAAIIDGRNRWLREGIFEVESLGSDFMAGVLEGVLERTLRGVTDTTVRKSITNDVVDEIGTKFEALGLPRERIAAIVSNSESRAEPVQHRRSQFESLQDFSDHYHVRPGMVMSLSLYYEGTKSIREIINRELDTAQKTMHQIFDVRDWMDANGARKRPLMIWQVLRLGEMYPFFTDKMLEDLGMVAVSPEEISEWYLEPAESLPKKIREARYLIIKARFPSRNTSRNKEPFSKLLNNIDRIAKKLNAGVLAIDHSVGIISMAQDSMSYELGGEPERFLSVLTKFDWKNKTKILNHSPFYLFLNPNNESKNSGKVSWMDDSLFLDLDLSTQDVPTEDVSNEINVAGTQASASFFARKAYAEATEEMFSKDSRYQTHRSSTLSDGRFRSESRGRDELTSRFEMSDALFVFVQPMLVFGNLGGKGRQKRFNLPDVVFQSSEPRLDIPESNFDILDSIFYAVKSSFNIVQSMMDELQSFAKDLKLASKVFEDDREFTVSGSVGSVFRLLWHFVSPGLSGERNLPKAKELVKKNSNNFNKNIQNQDILSRQLEIRPVFLRNKNSESRVEPTQSLIEAIPFIPKDISKPILSLGISAVGADEIYLAEKFPGAKIIGTTIDKEGIELTRQKVQESGLENRIELKIEDATKPWTDYKDQSIGFIYARLILHYLTKEQLEFVFKEIARVAAPGANIAITVLSEQHHWASLKGLLEVYSKEAQWDPVFIPDEAGGPGQIQDRKTNQILWRYDPETRLTHFWDTNANEFRQRQYLSPEALNAYALAAGLEVQDENLSRHAEKLFYDYARTQATDHVSSLLTMIATAPGNSESRLDYWKVLAPGNSESRTLDLSRVRNEIAAARRLRGEIFKKKTLEKLDVKSAWLDALQLLRLWASLDDEVNAIGDIHGNREAIQEIIEHIGEDLVIVTGDMIDQEKLNRSIKTITYLLSEQKSRRENEKSPLVLTLGNHEIDWLRGFLGEDKSLRKKILGDKQQHAFAKRMLRHIRLGNFVAAATLRNRLFSHAGFGGDLLVQLSKEILESRKEDVSKLKGNKILSRVSNEEIAEYANVIMREAFRQAMAAAKEGKNNTKDFFDHALFGKEGIFEVRNLQDDKVAKSRDQAFGHTPGGSIREEGNGTLVYLDLRIQEEIGNNRGYLKITPKGNLQGVHTYEGEWEEKTPKNLGKQKKRLHQHTYETLIRGWAKEYLKYFTNRSESRFESSFALWPITQEKLRSFFQGNIAVKLRKLRRWNSPAGIQDLQSKKLPTFGEVKDNPFLYFNRLFHFALLKFDIERIDLTVVFNFHGLFVLPNPKNSNQKNHFVFNRVDNFQDSTMEVSLRQTTTSIALQTVEEELLNSKSEARSLAYEMASILISMLPLLFSILSVNFLYPSIFRFPLVELFWAGAGVGLAAQLGIRWFQYGRPTLKTEDVFVSGVLTLSALMPPMALFVGFAATLIYSGVILNKIYNRALDDADSTSNERVKNSLTLLFLFGIPILDALLKFSLTFNQAEFVNNLTLIPHGLSFSLFALSATMWGISVSFYQLLRKHLGWVMLIASWTAHSTWHYVWKVAPDQIFFYEHPMNIADLFLMVGMGYSLTNLWRYGQEKLSDDISFQIAPLPREAPSPLLEEKRLFRAALLASLSLALGAESLLVKKLRLYLTINGRLALYSEPLHKPHEDNVEQVLGRIAFIHANQSLGGGRREFSKAMKDFYQRALATKESRKHFLKKFKPSGMKHHSSAIVLQARFQIYNDFRDIHEMEQEIKAGNVMAVLFAASSLESSRTLRTPMNYVEEAVKRIRKRWQDSKTKTQDLKRYFEGRSELEILALKKKYDGVFQEFIDAIKEESERRKQNQRSEVRSETELVEAALRPRKSEPRAGVSISAKKALFQSGFLSKRKIVADFRDAQKNLKETQILELLFFWDKGGKVLLHHFDPTTSLGKFFRDELKRLLPNGNIENLVLHSGDLESLAAEYFQDYEGEIFYLSSAASEARADELQKVFSSSGVSKEQVIAIAYQDETSGALGVGLKELKAGVLKSQLPDYFSFDPKGRFVVDSSMTLSWQERYQQQLVFVQSA